MQVHCSEPRSVTIAGLPNNGLHQTGRGGVAPRSPRPVIEARPAGEAECYADWSGGKGSR